MYLRTQQRRNKDGGVVRYVQLAHNRRVDGVTQAEVLVSLGGEDTLDRDGLVWLVASINRYLGLPQAGIPDAAVRVGDGLTVTGSRPMGTSHLLDGMWRQLGVDTALRPGWRRSAPQAPARSTATSSMLSHRRGSPDHHRRLRATDRAVSGRPQPGIACPARSRRWANAAAGTTPAFGTGFDSSKLTETRL